MKTSENITLDQLKELINKSAKDFVRNDKVLNSMVEERSGFYEGIGWTIKKLYKAGLLKVTDKEVK